eukprot:2522315-Amphidinium_carterae.1
MGADRHEERQATNPKAKKTRHHGECLAFSEMVTNFGLLRRISGAIRNPCLKTGNLHTNFTFLKLDA